MLRVPSTITKIVTLADNTVRLQVDCQELAPEDEAEIFKLRNQLGYFVYSISKKIETKDIPTEALDFPNEKSPSQRLRAVLYVIWEHAGKKGEFETYYRGKMERIIEQLKEKIE